MRAVMLAAALLLGAWALAAPTAGAADETESAASVRSDPASERLRYVIVGLVGLGGFLLVGTARFWWVTRPALVGAPEPRQARSAEPTSGSAPPRIPASVVLAGPLTTPSVIAPPTPAAPPVETPSAPSITTIDDAGLDEIPPPSGAPALLAPPPSDLEQSPPSGAEQPLVGDDSVWLIGDEPVAPEPAPEPAAFIPTTAVTGDAPAAATPPATASLIAALAALPDHTGSRVEFDDPPVERVVTRARVVRDPEPEPELDRASDVQPERDVQPDPHRTPEPDVELEPEIVLDGAPNYDRIARDTSEESAVLVDVPPVGMFYDQDLDPGDPPGRAG